MIPDSFDYVAATTLPEAVALLEQHGDEAKILAGGHSLIPLLRFRLSSISLLIDINRITGLEYIQETDGVLHIGALTREADLDQSPLIRNRYPILLDTSTSLADPTVRNWATVGGNLAHGDPANDHPATMLALGASVVAVGPNGQRIIPITEFFTDSPFETTLHPNEILTEIRVPAPTAHSGGAYIKLERKVGDYAIAGVAAYITLDDAGLVATAGIGLTNVGPYSIKALAAEQFLLGKPLDDAMIHKASALAATAALPTADMRGPADYKRAMVRTLTVRALRKALERIHQA
ncbi:MAG TPA: xanthine dehydrogenase family protein subunit M [Ktedonobacteraceae bacterium]|jgi:carbon-monoxide dehydrogenase medium subunit|nr:xanthine dehydrogenase family protein subunit M [Ktedonobacteraceae bacterium]